MPSLDNYDRANLNAGLREAMDRLSRAGYGYVGINSGHRTPGQNRAAGGARHSQHLHGKAIDIASKNWSNAQREAFLEAAVTAGFRGIGLYPSGNIHIDTRQTPGFWGPKGYTGNKLGDMPAYARPAIERMLAGVNPFEATPATGPTPFRPDQPNPNTLSPSTIDGIPGGIGGVGRMPLGPISMPSAPAPSPGFSGALMSPTTLDRLSPSSLASMAAATAPRGPMSTPVARAPDLAAMSSTASLSPVSMTSTPMSPVNVSSPLAPSAENIVGPAPGPNPASLAAAYGQLGSTLAQAGVKLGQMPAPNAPVATPPALPAVNAPVAMPQAPVQQPLAPPVQQPPPVRQMVPQSLPGGFPDTPPAPPSFSPADIYGGQVGTATATDGSTVGRDPFGRTTVTNQYGVTTAMTPDGKQAAYGGMPGPGGTTSLFGSGIGMPGIAPGGYRGLGTIGGAIVGAMLGGLPGVLSGGMLGRTIGGFADRHSFPSAPARSNVDYRNTSRVDFNGFGSGRNASAAEADRGGRGVSAGGTGLW